jgi:hypothetical protein
MAKKITLVSTLFIVAFFLPPVMAQGTGQQAQTSNAIAQNQVDPGEVTRVLQGGVPDDAGKATVTNFLRGFFTRWMDPNNAAELGRYRREIQPLIDSVTNPQGKDYLLSQFANYLYGFANKKDVYPAFRYNAVLALGELDLGQTNNIPTPYPRALEALYRIYEDKGDGKDMAREAIRLGALLGIRRHVVLGIANVQTRDERIAPLLMQIAADTPYRKDGKDDSAGIAVSTLSTPWPEDDDVLVLSVNPNAEKTSEPQRTIEVHNWFRNNAIETLGHLYGAGIAAQNEIVDTLLTRIEDDLELPSLRYQSAYSLSRFNRTIENSPDLLKRTTQALLTLGLVVHDDGIQTMMEEQSTQQTIGSMSTGGMGTTGEMGGMGSGGMASPVGQAQADQINNSLIQIKDGFTSISSCIQGAGGLLNSDVVKNTPYHQILSELNKIIADSVKFLDEGDPEAARRARAAAELGRGMDGTTMGGMRGGTSVTTTTTTVRNPPKVTMREIEDRLKLVKRNIETLQNVMRSLDAGLASTR